MDRYANKQNMAELSKAIHDKYSPTATTSSDGLMSASDKEKLDGIDVGANDYTLPLMSPTTLGGAKLDEHGGLVLRDEKLGIGSLVQESNGAVRGSIAELTAKGHAEQFSTTGKNLLPTSQSAWEVGSINPDGSDLVGSTLRLRTNGYSPIAQSTTYAFSCAEGYLIVAIYEYSANDASGFVLRTVFNVASGTITTQSTSQYFRLVLKRSDDSDVSLSDVKSAHPQLELGSEATEYEPYTGGAPSPSPDYPQEIQVVRGRNLLDASTVMADATKSEKTKTLQLSPNIIYTASSNIPKATDNTANFFVYPTGQLASTNTNGVWHGTPRTFKTASDGVLNIMYRTANQPDTSAASFLAHDFQLTLGSTPQPYVPYGHVGMEVQGKNLFNPSYLLTDAGWTESDGVYTGQSINFYTAFANGYPALTFEQDAQYTFSLDFDYSGDTGTAVACEFLYTDGTRSSSYFDQKNHHYAVVSTSGKTVSKFILGYGTNRTTSMSNIQLELGSTATEYEPYYHTTTPIPLPSRGWVAGLPDGTADSLRLDGAGKVEWELDSSLTVYSSCLAAYGTRVTLSEIGIAKEFDNYSVPCVMCSHLTAFPAGNLESYNGSGISINNAGQIVIKVIGITGKTAYDEWLQSNPVTVLYPLATPVTEECGYCEDWPTDLPEGATVTIPELDEVGIRYFVDSAVTELAQQWYARANSEYADRITALEQAVAELATS